MCLTDGCDRPTRRSVVLAGAMLPLAACATGAGESGMAHGPWRYEREGASIDAYLARPARGGAAPAVVVLHGNGGLPADVAETTLWLAGLGFVGLAVSSNSREPDIERIPATFLRSQAYQDRYVADARAGVARLRSEGTATGSPVGILGYCGGGYAGLSWCASDHGAEVGAVLGFHVATHHLRGSAVPYHRPPGIDHYRRTAAPVQLHQGGADPYTPPEDLDELRRVAAEAGKALELYVYPQAGHGFALSTDPGYRPDDTALARARAAPFLRRHLRG